MKNFEINKLSLKEKISQMLILGFSGTCLNSGNINIQHLAKNGLGGVILFAENIDTYEQTQKLSSELQNTAKIPLFISIDQEGGLVERTININNKIDYLTAMALASADNPEFVKKHTEIMAEELKFMGINMDFDPVLDVNTNINNPVIGVRSFGNNPEDVVKYSKAVYKTFAENNIIPVGKHFPGHGDTCVDSHLDMPVVELSFEELENIHIKPFKETIINKIEALMIAHVFYKAFGKESVPASLSHEIISGYLKEKLNFKGLIISDDMVMGGISKHYNYLDACIKGINAGIDIFIFRTSSDEIIKLIDNLENAVKQNLIPVERINESVEKILLTKEKFGVLQGLSTVMPEITNFKNYQDEIDKIAIKSVKIEKRGNLLPLNKNKKFLILSPDKSEIFNLAKDTSKISDFLKEEIDCKEIIYRLNPEKEEIENILNESKNYDQIIFVEYNSVFYKNQLELLSKIKPPVILISTGVPFVLNKQIKIDSLITSHCLRKPSVKAVSKKLIGF